MKTTEAIAKSIVKHVEAHPMCKRFDAEVSAKVGKASHAWELVKHLFDFEKISKSYFYTRNREVFSLNRPKKRKQYTGVSAKTVSTAARIEMLLEKGASYTGSEIRRHLKITLSNYKTAILEADVTRYSLNGNGYLYAKAGSIKLNAGNTKTAEVAQTILFLVDARPKISAEDIRTELGLDVIVFRCAMKLISDKVRKNHINYKPHYTLVDAFVPTRIEAIEAIETVSTFKYEGKILTQWRTALPWQ